MGSSTQKDAVRFYQLDFLKLASLEKLRIFAQIY
jgi:hypothetical protein